MNSEDIVDQMALRFTRNYLYIVLKLMSAVINRTAQYIYFYSMVSLYQAVVQTAFMRRSLHMCLHICHRCPYGEAIPDTESLEAILLFTLPLQEERLCIRAKVYLNTSIIELIVLMQNASFWF